MKKVFFSQSSSAEKVSLESMIQENNLESILGGASENFCQDDMSENSESIKVESEKNDSIYYRRVVPTRPVKN
ncbi:MAG: hypothetical protein BHV67_05895 [Bacteroidales bacterium 43_36]|nr:MAG: hypothetical protein BHV67_05895 [Bacteroidales bacterium 43_36]